MKRSRVLCSMLLLAVVPAGGLAQQTRSGQENPMTSMSRASLEGIELEYEVRGGGEPVVLVHAGVFASWFRPFTSEPALAGRYRVVSYHRVGYMGSSRVAGPVSLAQQAVQLRALMRHLGIGRAHLVGHSSGGNIALQLALDAPEMVQSLALLEPALVTVVNRSELPRVFERYRAGDKAGAVDAFMLAVTGPAYRAGLERALPGAFDEAVAHADTFFGQELPAVRQWSFTREQAARITQPVLAVIGEKNRESSPVWNERQEILLTWLPKAEPFVLPGATHLLHLENPRGMAEALAAFFGRHPIQTP
jgi:pimeloyl-ACP methyl ester carboxylesterase